MKRIIEIFPRLVVSVLLFVLLALIHRSDKGGDYSTGIPPQHEMILEKKIAESYPEYKALSIQDSVLSFVQDSDGKTLGYILQSTAVARQIQGFGGQTPLCIFLDKDALILNLCLLPNSETPSYLQSFTDKNPFRVWNGLTIEQAINTPPDILSGATLTSSALRKTAQACLQAYSGLKIEKDRSMLKIVANISAILVLLFALLSFFKPKEMKKYRLYLLLLLVGVLGFWQAKVFSLALFYNWLVSGWQMAFWFLISVFVFQLFSLLFLGKNFYCTYLCPYGALQELLGRISKQKIHIPLKIAVYLYHFGEKIVWVCLFILISGFTINLANIEVFAAFKIGKSSYFVLALFVFFAVLSIFIRRPWCQSFCPTGFLWEIFKINKNRLNTNNTMKRKFSISELLNILLAIALIVLILVEHQSPRIKNKEHSEVQTQVSETPTALDIIHQRKSVRNFVHRKMIRKEDLLTMAKAGMAAPSARNAQPWEILLISDTNIMNALQKDLPYAKMLADAGAAVVVCGNMEKALDGEGQAYWIQDASAVTQNILLAAETLGLGAVWTGVYPIQERVMTVSQVLSLPKNIIPLAVIPVGYSTGIDKPKQKFTEEKLHWEKW